MVNTSAGRVTSSRGSFGKCSHTKYIMHVREIPKKKPPKTLFDLYDIVLIFNEIITYFLY